MPAMRTTSFIVDLPINTSRLSEPFTLVRYDVPETFTYKPGKIKYARLHTEVRSQSWHPYYFFTHDKHGPSRYALYMLYSHNDPIQDISINFLSSYPLQRQVASFDHLPLHLIIKLLQANYFGIRDTARFTSQGKHFIQAKAGDRQVICLEAEIKGDIRNNETHGPQILKVIGHAARFIRVDPTTISESSKYLNDYFRKLSPKHGQTLFTYLPASEVDSSTVPLYCLRRKSGDPATLDYHSVSDPTHTRGYLLYRFVNNFLDYLKSFGIEAYQQRRIFNPHTVDQRRTELVINDNLVVCLLDQRLNQANVPLSAYHALLSDAFPTHTFEMIDRVSAAAQRPTLVLHDANAEDFAEDGIFAGEIDPYQQLYRQAEYHDWPKQSININPNDVEQAITREDYLTYPICSLNDKEHRFQLRFAVCLSELFLKDLILNGKRAVGQLPYLDRLNQGTVLPAAIPLEEYAFLRRRTFKGRSYHTVLYFDAGRAAFLDLRDPDDKEAFDKLLAKLGLNWEHDIEGVWLTKYRKERMEDEEQRKTPYDFILGPGLVIEVEDCEEHVLYEYDAIDERRQAVNEALPIAALKLASHYDKLRTQKHLPLVQFGTVSQQALAGELRIKKLKESLTFLRQLETFDTYLDELAIHRQTITFNDLTNGENAQRIEQIFGLKPTSPQTTARAHLKRLYQRLGMFPSDKARDVQIYQGIWYDDEGRFMVGSPDSLKFTQPRAHRIRTFDVYRGKEQFNMAQFLDTLAVTFVRPEQYTVYPYFFHLIDMYVESKLSWGLGPTIVTK